MKKKWKRKILRPANSIFDQVTVNIFSSFIFVFNCFIAEIYNKIETCLSDSSTNSNSDTKSNNSKTMVYNTIFPFFYILFHSIKYCKYICICVIHRRETTATVIFLEILTSSLPYTPYIKFFPPKILEDGSRSFSWRIINFLHLEITCYEILL